MFTLYAVVRNCCTSGNCFSCSGITPFGTPRRVEHWRGTNEATAKAVVENWRAYSPELVENPEPRSMDGMALALYNDQAGTSRELAIPPGLTWSEAVAWAEQYRGSCERIGDTFQYSLRKRELPSARGTGSLYYSPRPAGPSLILPGALP